MKLLISFAGKDKSFVHGVELGRILEKMEKNENPVMNNGFPVRIENKDVIIRSCKAFNYTAIFGEEYYGEWISFMALKNLASEN